ncbi:MAG TPA: PTS sugar transporter subunit IIA [Longimicrobiaceae bacterium]|nr:PTS sugar transporter subunit IIA [Longimicrobiaceae bacterium]
MPRRLHRRPEVLVLLTELLAPERIRIPLRASTKDELLGELVGLLGPDDGVTDPAAVLRAVRDREQVLSTGIGHGVAIPHGKSDAIGELRLAAGVARPGVDFEALDGRPVQLFFLLVGPEAAAGQHVKALSRISRLLRRDVFRERLAAASTPEEFYSVVTEAELT